ARPVRHTGRRRDIISVKCEASSSQPIHIWRSHDVVAIAADMIGPVLVRNDEKKIGPLGSHNGDLCSDVP
mgnify:CR=1